jgi:hypothetical protein
MRRTTFLILAGMLAAGNIVWAHHSFSSQFDVSKPSHLEGKVVRVEWERPHVLISLNVKDSTGATAEWTVEASQISLFEFNGWFKDSVTPGMNVRVGGYPAKNGSKLFGSTGFTLVDTRRVFKTSPCWMLSNTTPQEFRPERCPVPDVP